MFQKLNQYPNIEEILSDPMKLEKEAEFVFRAFDSGNDGEAPNTKKRSKAIDVGFRALSTVKNMLVSPPAKSASVNE